MSFSRVESHWGLTWHGVKGVIDIHSCWIFDTIFAYNNLSFIIDEYLYIRTLSYEHYASKTCSGYLLIHGLFSFAGSIPRWGKLTVEFSLWMVSVHIFHTEKNISYSQSYEILLHMNTERLRWKLWNRFVSNIVHIYKIYSSQVTVR